VKILQPPGWMRPKGYSNGVAARGLMVFVAGQIGWNERCEFDALDFLGQARQALRNVATVLEQTGAAPSDVVRLTWYVVDKRAFLADSEALGAIYREVFGDHYPAMTAVQVSALIEDRALIEVEATAVVCDPKEPKAKS
jgi:enamine deaminase RidA (YjgF/YER057c/UK114 family)